MLKHLKNVRELANQGQLLDKANRARRGQYEGQQLHRPTVKLESADRPCDHPASLQIIKWSPASHIQVEITKD